MRRPVAALLLALTTANCVTVVYSDRHEPTPAERRAEVRSIYRRFGFPMLIGGVADTLIASTSLAVLKSNETDLTAGTTPVVPFVVWGVAGLISAIAGGVLLSAGLATDIDQPEPGSVDNEGARTSTSPTDSFWGRRRQ